MKQLILSTIVILCSSSVLAQQPTIQELLWYSAPSTSASGFIDGDVRSNRTCQLEVKFQDVTIDSGDLVITIAVNPAEGFDGESNEFRIPIYKRDPKTNKETRLFPLTAQKFSMRKKGETASFANNLLLIRKSLPNGETLVLRMNVTDKLIPHSSINIQRFRYIGLESLGRKEFLNYNCSFDATAIYRSLPAE